MFVQVHSLNLGDKNAKKVKNNNVLVPHKSAPDSSVYRNMPSHRSKSKARSKRSGDGSDAPEVTTTTEWRIEKLGMSTTKFALSEVMLTPSSTATVSESLWKTWKGQC